MPDVSSRLGILIEIETMLEKLEALAVKIDELHALYVRDRRNVR